MIVVCALSSLASVQRQYAPSHVVSLLSPGQACDDTIAPGAQMLTARFHDIAEPLPPLIGASKTEIERLLTFAGGWAAERPMLIHCWAGISRSGAAAYIVACAKKHGCEEQIARTLRSRAPFATPNPLMVALADGILERDGRMIAAIDQIGRGVDAAEGTPYELPID
jgi:predicted protein tyrosine phosphatase